VGVSPEHRAHIFDRFYQAHAGGPLTSMAGMGLGLYISRQIVELHGGTIEAEFPETGGTKFVVTLPHLPPAPAPD
jgi:signal transduction histidine kinase